MADASKVLADLARAKVLFQLRSLSALINEQPAKSKPDQERDKEGG